MSYTTILCLKNFVVCLKVSNFESVVLKNSLKSLHIYDIHKCKNKHLLHKQMVHQISGIKLSLSKYIKRPI